RRQGTRVRVGAFKEGKSEAAEERGEEAQRRLKRLAARAGKTPPGDSPPIQDYRRSGAPRKIRKGYFGAAAESFSLPWPRTAFRVAASRCDRKVFGTSRMMGLTSQAKTNGTVRLSSMAST